VSGAARVGVASAIILVAALGFFVWMQRGRSRDATATPAPAPAVDRAAPAPAAAAGPAPAAPSAAAPEAAAAGRWHFHNPAEDTTGVPAQRLNVPKPFIPHMTKPNPEAIRLQLHPTEP
jgi:hypothetical protein